MRTRQYKYILLISLLMFQANDSYPDPIPGFDPIGADAAAMGGAVTALSLSSTSIYHNPAAMIDQVISGGVGIQPVRFNEYPKSWWVNLYNRNTDYGFPLSLMIQGWEAPTASGDRRNFMFGIPLAYKFSPYSPAALNLKWAFERTPSGNWIAGVPVDFGFIARNNRGANIGVVFRNITIGGNRFETMQTRTDAGIAYETGVATFSTATSANSWNDLRYTKDRVRTGFEISSNPAFILRGGYVRWDDGRWYTGGIGLRSTEAGMYVDYAVIHDETNGGWTHFVQYIYMMR